MKNLQNLGKALSKAEQKSINGGLRFYLGNECINDYQCTGEENVCCGGICIYLNQNAGGIHC